MTSFGAGLAKAAGVAPRLISDRPPEWRLGPLTIVARAGGAEVRYARERVARATGGPEEVVAAWRRALGTLRARSLAPEVFLPLLLDSYRAIHDGDWVDLVSVRAEVVRRHRGHTRAQFAWDLARLRSERRLSHEGRRVELAVATGNAAIQLRSRVVWIEDESGAGQYYLRFRM